MNAKVSKLVASDTDAKLLAEAVCTNPKEATPIAQFVDRLQELGIAPKTAKIYAKHLILNATPITDWPKAELSKLLRGTSIEAIAGSLAVANGRRRERTLDLGDALRACRRVRHVGYASDGGGTVANAYGYAAVQTAIVVAVRTDGTLRVAIRAINASKSTSTTNQLAGISVRGTADDYRAWADATTANGV